MMFFFFVSQSALRSNLLHFVCWCRETMQFSCVSFWHHAEQYFVEFSDHRKGHFFRNRCDILEISVCTRCGSPIIFTFTVIIPFYFTVIIIGTGTVSDNNDGIVSDTVTGIVYSFILPVIKVFFSRHNYWYWYWY